MKKHNFKELLSAVRYRSFPVSVMPVIVTFAYLYSTDQVPSGAESIIDLLLFLICVTMIHAAGNLLSDYYDFKSGGGNEKAFAAPSLVSGKFEAKEYLLFSMIFFSCGCLIGLFLIMSRGYALLTTGFVSIVLIVLYPYLKHRAMGGADVFLIISVLLILGTSCVITGHFCCNTLVLALPVGLLTIAVLHINNIQDIDLDRNAGVRTLAMVIGAEASVYLYGLYMILPFLAVIVAVLLGYLTPFCLLCLPAAILACRNLKSARGFKGHGPQSIQGLDRATARLQLIFTALLTSGFFLAAL